MASSRDLRIDFFRGLALLIVLIDHIEQWSDHCLIQTWTLISLGFSDAAEIFVFLSGYVFATAYAGTLDRQGWVACLKKACKRSLQIYAAYLIAALAVIGIGVLCLSWNPPEYNAALQVGQRPWASALAALALCYHPCGFDVLSFYAIILPVMAVLLVLQRRAAWLAWGLSGGVYLLAQCFPQINLPRFGDNENWFFNPLAWQFLFFLGICLGDPRRKRREIVPRWLLMSASVAILLLGVFALKSPIHVYHWDRTWFESLIPVYRFCHVWSTKSTLGPLRLLHFFAMVYFTATVLPKTLSFWSTAWARPLVVAGQHSLEVFAAGLVLSFVSVFLIIRVFPTTAAVLLFDAAACAASIGFAYFVGWWKSRKRHVLATPSPSAAPDSRPPKPETRGRRSKVKPRRP